MPGGKCQGYSQSCQQVLRPEMDHALQASGNIRFRVSLVSVSGMAVAVLFVRRTDVPASSVPSRGSARFKDTSEPSDRESPGTHRAD